MKELSYLGCLLLLAFFIHKAESISCGTTISCPDVYICQSNTCVCPNGMIADDINRVCNCPANNLKILDPPKCLPIALYPGFGCEVNEQCQTLGVDVVVTCIDSKCKCPESTHVSGLKCYKNITLGNECLRDEECTTQANPFALCQPTSRKCACIDGFKEDPKYPKICAPGGISVKPGDDCFYDPYCRAFLGNGSVCIGQTCNCLDNYHYVNSSQKCLVNKALGEPCTNLDGECYLPKSEHPAGCKENKCACLSGIASEDKQQCYNVSSINQSITSLLVISLILAFFRSSS